MNSLPPDLTGPIEIAPMDAIDQFEDTGRRFLAEVLNMSWSACLLTDESTLSDFSGRGPCGPLPEGTLEEYHAAWDAWVIERIEGTYGVRIANTSVTLVDLFRKLEAAARQSTVH